LILNVFSFFAFQFIQYFIDDFYDKNDLIQYVRNLNILTTSICLRFTNNKKGEVVSNTNYLTCYGNKMISDLWWNVFILPFGTFLKRFNWMCWSTFEKLQFFSSSHQTILHIPLKIEFTSDGWKYFEQAVLTCIIIISGTVYYFQNNDNSVLILIPMALKTAPCGKTDSRFFLRNDCRFEYDLNAVTTRWTRFHSNSPSECYAFELECSENICCIKRYRQSPVMYFNNNYCVTITLTFPDGVV